jgi:threonine/homoserine/homoserine lactone efflux protein
VKVQDPLLFALAVLAILGTPGPTNTLLATSGASAGLRRSLGLVPAEAAGYAISILTIGLLLGPWIAGQPMVAAGMRVVVGFYLLWLAARLWRRGGSLLDVRLVTPREVFVTTLLNPKAIVFALGIVPFGASPVWPYLLGFLVLLAAVALAWIAVGAALGRAAGRAGWSGVVPRIGAAAMGSFAVLLVAAPLLR